MMAHRLILTAVAPPKIVARSVSRTKPLFSKVSVLLGDPTLPDMVKVNGAFNELDLETVSRMQDALRVFVIRHGFCKPDMVTCSFVCEATVAL